MKVVEYIKTLFWDLSWNLIKKSKAAMQMTRKWVSPICFALPYYECTRTTRCKVCKCNPCLLDKIISLHKQYRITPAVFGASGNCPTSSVYSFTFLYLGYTVPSRGKLQIPPYIRKFSSSYVIMIKPNIAATRIIMFIPCHTSFNDDTK